MTTKDVAVYLKISTQQVRRLVSQHLLPCIRVSDRVIRFRPQDVEKFLEAREI
jgi:excisionase family DNA binding protein|nr:MAG TPA: helix-turn-helix domain protein [Caudoviricetes sp.]